MIVTWVCGCLGDRYVGVGVSRSSLHGCVGVLVIVTWVWGCLGHRYMGVGVSW